MEDLTFGEQVKIILGRKGMTIKQLAELIEEKTGKKMSRQNLTQRLGRDNFQEQDMRMIAAILECPFRLSIMSADVQAQPRSTASLEKAAAARTEAVERMSEQERADLARRVESTILEVEEEPVLEEPVMESPVQEEPVLKEPVLEQPAQEEPVMEYGSADEAYEAGTAAGETAADADETAAPEYGTTAEMQEESDERDVTIGELYDMHETLEKLEENVRAGERVEEIKKELEKPKREGFFSGVFMRRRRSEEKKHGRAQEEEHTQDKAAEQASHVSADENSYSGGQEGSYYSSPEQEETGVREDVRKDSMSGEAYSESENSFSDEYAGESQAAAYAEQENMAGTAAEETAYGESGSEEPEEYADESAGFEPESTTEEAEPDGPVGEINPYTGREYQSNSVRMHPTRIGYVQVYDRTIHKWTDMTEWAFLGLQERKKALLGKAYEPPVYLD